jgi:hypothetical protein
MGPRCQVTIRYTEDDRARIERAREKLAAEAVTHPHRQDVIVYLVRLGLERMGLR